MNAKFATAVFEELRRLGHLVEREERFGACWRAFVDGLPSWFKPSDASAEVVCFGIYAFGFNDYEIHTSDPVALAAALSRRHEPILREWKPYAEMWSRLRENKVVAARVYDEIVGKGAHARRERCITLDGRPHLIADFDGLILTASKLTQSHAEQLVAYARSSRPHERITITAERRGWVVRVGGLTEDVARTLVLLAKEMGLFERRRVKPAIGST
jgi:hypothetical protein